jgi:lipid-A-disaccharide synthase-like uncharacterized protein
MLEKLWEEMAKEPMWTLVGFMGQFTFGSRFVLQWLVSEYKKQSHVPHAFWFLSLIGSIILLIYSVHEKNVVFIAGFSLNGFIYLRNIHLIYKNKAAQTAIATVLQDEED